MRSCTCHPFLLSLLAVFAGPCDAGAATYPVSDAEMIANHAAMLRSSEDALRMLGEATKPGTLLGNLQGLQQAIGNAGVAAAPKALPRLATEGFAPKADRWGGQADWSSLAGAQQAVRAQLFAGEDAASTATLALQSLTARRALAVHRAGEDAAALALATRTKLLGDGATAERLAQGADVTDLRGAVQANTDALLAVHDRTTEAALLLTALLELRAVRAIEADKPQAER